MCKYVCIYTYKVVSLKYYSTSVSQTFPANLCFLLVYVQIAFCSVYVAEWLPFEKELPAWFTLCSLYIMSICNFDYFPFWFEDRIWDLIAQFLNLNLNSLLVKRQK